MLSPEHAHPLTCGQRWLLHIAQHAPELAKSVQRVYRLPSPVDTAGLLAAFRRVVDEQEALRLRLVETSEGVRQAFPPLSASIAGLAIRGATAEHRAAYAQQMLLEYARGAIDPRAEPPFRAHVLRLDGEHLLSLCVDHMAADEIAFDELERQLARAYLEERSGLVRPAHAGASSPTFLDFVAREAAQRHREAENLEYWRAHLAGAPLGPPRAGETRWARGRSARWQLSEGSFGRLTRACRAQACSPFAAVLAAQARLLADLDEVGDLVINVPLSNRSQASDHRIIGNLSMLLHLRVRLDRGEPAPSLLRRVRDQLLQAMARRYYDYAALSELVAEEAAARSGRARWTVGSSYIVERGPAEEIAGLERVEDPTGPSFDVPEGTFMLSCRQRPSGLSLFVEWDPARWPVEAEDLAPRLLDMLSLVSGADLRGSPEDHQGR